MGEPFRLADVLSDELNVSKWKVVPESIPMSMVFDGDWVYRAGAPEPQVVEALAALLSGRLGRPVHFESRQATRDTYVFSGPVHHTPPLAGQPDDGVIRFGSLAFRSQPARLPLAERLANLGRRAELPVVDETADAGAVVNADDDGTHSSTNFRAALDVLARRAGLRYALEQRPVAVWALVDANGQQFPSDEPLPATGADQ